ncbi:MAG: hypothetical protein J5858_00665 [Lentisphaeria bacterium]|nr:hypothetical protein [Lentisphaeria bacterium]
MKSLQKTFDILEYVVLRNGESVTPSRAAEELGINTVTCTRIMGELVKRGYLVQVSRKEGYIPGPMIITLNTRHNCYEQLAAAAHGPISRLSERMHCQVNLSVMNREHRIMLCYHLHSLNLKPWDHFSFTDHWETATGRLLIALMEEKEARKLTREAGICPFPKKELERIRRDGWVRFEQDQLIVIGRGIQIPGYPAAAFGFGVAPELEKTAMEASAETAGEIIRILQKPNQAY